MRTVLNFNEKWLFNKKGENVSNEQELVNIPHCWNAVDGMDGGNDYYRGTACYQKSFNKSDLPESDKYYLEIKGANSSASVYLNGEKLATHHGGYSTWRVELKNLSDENSLVIEVDNSANETVYPQMADFTFYGGVYRDVSIICVNDSHFELDYYGTPGIKITPEIKGSDADVEIEVYLAMEGRSKSSSGYATNIELKTNDGTYTLSSSGFDDDYSVIKQFLSCFDEDIIKVDNTYSDETDEWQFYGYSDHPEIFEEIYK